MKTENLDSGERAHFLKNKMKKEEGALVLGSHQSLEEGPECSVSLHS